REPDSADLSTSYRPLVLRRIPRQRHLPVYFLPSNPRTWRRAARLAISYAKSSSLPNDHLRRGGAVESLPVSFSHAERRQLEPGERFPLVYYCGVGSEGDGAGLNAVDLARRGWKALLAQTKQWLDKRARPAPTEQARARINQHVLQLVPRRRADHRHRRLGAGHIPFAPLLRRRRPLVPRQPAVGFPRRMDGRPPGGPPAPFGRLPPVHPQGRLAALYIDGALLD